MPGIISTSITDSLNQKADSASISLEIEQKIPEILLGDAGGICQLIDKFAALFTENGGKSLQLGISSYKRGYAEMLKIQLCSESAELSDEQIGKIRNIITSDEEYYAETMSELALSIVRTQIRAMSGTFDIFRLLRTFGKGISILYVSAFSDKPCREQCLYTRYCKRLSFRCCYRR